MAIDAGISIEAFWNYSLNEIIDILESISREEKRRRKEKIIDAFIIAEVTAMNLAALFSSDEKIKFPKPWDYYDKIFDEEKEVFKQQELERQLEEYKEKRRAYVAEVNRRRQQGLM